jgi:regulator of protease activity HflC (stomatin/prohibitin superfamily)
VFGRVNATVQELVQRGECLSLPSEPARDLASVRILKQYERGVQFRLGEAKGEARGPGMILIAPLLDRVHRASLRIVTMPIQSRGIITKDNVSVDVSAVAYFRVEGSVRSVLAIENVNEAISQIAQYDAPSWRRRAYPR